jgi:hypothetical protein
MGRAFPFTYQGRALRISTMTVDEGWELWVVEGERKVMCVARVSVDEVVERARRGEDLIASIAEKAKSRILSTGLDLALHDAQPDAWETSAYRLL